MTRRALTGRNEVPNLSALQPPLRLATARRVDAGLIDRTIGGRNSQRRAAPRLEARTTDGAPIAE